MSSNNQYGRGPWANRNRDKWEESYHQGAPSGKWEASFGGAGQGSRFGEDKNRGYFGAGSAEAGFASGYSHSYGRDDYRSEEQRRQEHPGAHRDDGNRQRRWETYDWEDRVAQHPQSERRQEDGPHRGKGPRNYRRSDERIREDVSDRLSDDPYVDASDIDINVQDGNVILSGRVDHREARRRAVELAESVRGVTNVESHLRTGQTMLENLSHAVTAAIGDVTVGPDISTVETPRKGRKKK